MAVPATVAAATSLNDPQVAERLAAWSRALAPQCPDALRHRLEWDGLDAANLPTALHPRFSADATPPTWLDTLAEVLVAAPQPVTDEDVAALAAGDPSTPPVPFGEALAPFLRVARVHLETARHAAGWSPPSATALTQWEAHLLRKLSLQASQAFFERFAEYRAGLEGASSVKSERHGHDWCYRTFVETLLRGGGLLSLFREYAVLARRLVFLTRSWTDNVARLLTRLHADRREIATLFFGGANPGELQGVVPGLSDPHAGGQQVAVLRFASGHQLVYKPKDLGHERAYHALLGWLRTHGLADDAPPSLRVLARPGYGWAEFACAAPCENHDDLVGYHRRAGVLLSLVHALGGDDCHRQNLLATRGGPLLLDVESLLRPPLEAWIHGPPPRVDGDVRSPSPTSPGPHHARTVLHTGLLPVRRVTTNPPGPGGQRPPPDISGLRGRAAAGNNHHGSRKLTWREPNTDAMCPVWEHAAGVPTQNLPTLPGEDNGDNQPVLPERFSAELVAGFEAGYRFLLTHRAALTAPDGPLSAFVSGTSRLIFRPTPIYAKLLQNLANPVYQREGIERSLAIEALARAFVTAPEQPFFWPLLALERAALEDGDVPLFTAQTVATAFGVAPGNFFADPAALLTDLSEADLAYQRDLLQVTLDDVTADAAGPTSDLSGQTTPGVDDLEPAPASGCPLPRLTPDELVSEAVRLGRRMVAAVLETSGEDPGESFCPAVSPTRLYDGDLGVALFLAALERVTASGEHRSRIHALCRRVVRAIEDGVTDLSPEGRALGAYTGWGGTVYGLLSIGCLLKDPAYREFAHQAARQITPERIAADRHHDVFAGAAGALLSLLALHRATGSAAALDVAVQCGRHLVATSQPGPRGGRAWPAPIPAAPMLAGFAHGAAGIASALLQLFTWRPQPEFLEAARAAVIYERTLYQPAHQNWPYLRSAPGQEDPAKDQSPRWFKTWCHGAPSVALGRLAGLEVLDVPSVRRETDLALATTADVTLPLPALDHLCCGNFGRIGILHFAAQRIGRSALADRAHAWAALVVRRAAASPDGYELDSDPNPPPTTATTDGRRRVPEAGLFRGLAGIGYTLLRLADDRVLPPILIPH